MGTLGSKAPQLLRALPAQSFQPDVITFTQAVKTCEIGLL